MPGHWLLARMGKRVLRPGGLELTRHVLADAGLADADVVELAPGLGKTAADILAAHPKSYVGVESDPAAVKLTTKVLKRRGTVVQADAANTGLRDDSRDVVVGEAMLTMQSERGKDAIIAEAFRVLRPGGRYAVHELALEPDTLTDEQKTEIRKALARAIKVNARPLTEAEWRERFTAAGFEVERVRFARMALLEPRRVVADEGPFRTLKIVGNVATHSDARRRILGMRKVFRKYRRELTAIEIIARKPADA
ncbi:class I SAM-dependent methyltransferase [Gordonia sp. (in: high G+C Gram-positive bacteria)]|uniref:class I SAM-dependent methyltransferase n=1 Tax=Gordonia sp. (in: high G+C Gram-positive bacteria) TaxID=84139 RepID=UPI0039E28840